MSSAITQKRASASPENRGTKPVSLSPEEAAKYIELDIPPREAARLSRSEGFILRNKELTIILIAIILGFLAFCLYCTKEYFIPAKTTSESTTHSTETSTTQPSEHKKSVVSDFMPFYTAVAVDIIMFLLNLKFTRRIFNQSQQSSNTPDQSYYPTPADITQAINSLASSLNTPRAQRGGEAGNERTPAVYNHHHADRYALSPRNTRGTPLFTPTMQLS